MVSCVWLHVEKDNDNILQTVSDPIRFPELRVNKLLSYPSSMSPRVLFSLIVLKPGPVRPGGSTQDPADLELEPDLLKEKTRKEKTLCNPTDLTG